MPHLTASHQQPFRQSSLQVGYTPSPAEAEFVDLTAGFGTIQLLLMIRPDFLSSPARLELEAC
ncbi:hypothetical protein, partial [Roseinatronobacter ekhonensis]|uniref:hypothetical protein n=1 Tax=Roseinatronobacter ekhonensis TaxID=254356 RepID=UPI001C7D1A77